MLRLIKQNITGLKHPMYASLTLAFASLGDAFLYAFLPQYAALMEIPAVWVGVLLSINRFIRIAFNQVVVKLYARFGVRQTTIAASICAIASTLGYSLGWGLIALLLFRMLWGMSFAVLRISTMAYAFEHERIGFSLGATKSVQELGPLFALLIGPLLLSEDVGEISFIYIALLSSPALLYAFHLPELTYIATARERRRFRLPSLLNTTTFLLSFIADGMLIVIIGALLVHNNEQLTRNMIISLVAGYLAYRRISSIVLAPVSGVLADRLGFRQIFSWSLSFVIIGLIFIIIGWEMVGLVTIFTFSCVNSSIAPGGSLIDTRDKIQSVTTNATWRDIGMASGTLVGGLLLTSGLLPGALVTGTFMLGALLLLHYKKLNKT
jgi:MFS transporter, DHA1 family, multidrug resistance protein